MTDKPPFQLGDIYAWRQPDYRVSRTFLLIKRVSAVERGEWWICFWLQKQYNEEFFLDYSIIDEYLFRLNEDYRGPA